MFLYKATVLVNFLALAVSVWLGIYLVTRNPRNLVAWLTGLTLWSVAGLFFNVLMALDPPPATPTPSDWLRLLFPFWSASVLQGQTMGWFQGWAVTPAIVLWHHVTTLMRPGRLNAWRWTRILSGYAVALAAIVVQINTPIIYSDEGDNPLYLNALHSGQLYLFFATCLLVYSWGSFINLVRTARATPQVIPRKQITTLAKATFAAGLVGPMSIAGTALGLPIPTVVLSLSIAIAVVVIGYGVARYSALVEGRTMRRDFLYNASAVGLVALLYLGVTKVLDLLYGIPRGVYIFIAILAIVTHSLVDIGRRALDVVFFRYHTQALRADLRRLARMPDPREGLREILSNVLDAMCYSVRATFGLLLLFEGQKIDQFASYRWRSGEVELNASDLLADDVVHLELDQLPGMLAEAALIIPLYAEAKQLGALVLGRPENGVHYSRQDLEQLIDPSDHIAEAIRESRWEGEYFARLAHLVQDGRSGYAPEPDTLMVSIVEHALRNLFDYACLANTPLAELRIVKSYLPDGSTTHLDYGKVIHDLVIDAMEKLRPAGERPRYPIPREWYAYLVLHEAYIEDRDNRDIMADLYISEGTFNRTRRSAIRAVTRVLGEMEAAAV